MTQTLDQEEVLALAVGSVVEYRTSYGLDNGTYVITGEVVQTRPFIEVVIRSAQCGGRHVPTPTSARCLVPSAAFGYGGARIVPSYG